jgi:hypothetical protein
MMAMPIVSTDLAVLLVLEMCWLLATGRVALRRHEIADLGAPGTRIQQTIAAEKLADIEWDRALVTYEQVADSLPASVREAIEVSAPCRGAADHQHLWDAEVVRSTKARPRQHWTCVHCSATTTTNPIPVDRRVREFWTDEPDWPKL